MKSDEIPNYYMLGASYGGNDDQTERFVREGIWVNGWQDRNLDTVRAIKVGDRVAIKAAFTRKNDLPFDSGGKAISTMRIKATGVVTDNLGDGRHLKVDWTPLEPPREWYLYTYQPTIWKLKMDDWRAQALVDFTFDGVEQDFSRFAEHPFHRSRFKSSEVPSVEFPWTEFNEELASRLLDFKDDRAGLITVLKKIAEKEKMGIFNDKFADGSTDFMRDVCPFTFMALYNRGMTDTNRARIAGMVAKELDLVTPAPTTFPGVPTINNQSTWFFAYSKDRQPEDIDILWDLFDAAWQLASNITSTENPDKSFILAWDRALHVKQVKWNISSGLYRAMPWHYATLDSQTRRYLDSHFGINATSGKRHTPPSGARYLEIIEELKACFDDGDSPVHSFPELSHAAYVESGTDTDPEDDTGGESPDIATTTESVSVVSSPYTTASILDEGCFLPIEEIESLLQRARSKKNLILQGPPGTGKTWLAKRLGYALCGCKSETQVRSVQFHPTLSYEDFVRGWRPSGDGKLALADGIFLEMVNAARNDESRAYVLVIEEINRGNPAQIFGELLTLIEAGRRREEDALELCYRSATEDNRVYVPANLYIIGTMNLADRSLAIVDFALRRRFAFANLKPTLGSAWHTWVRAEFNVDRAVAGRIELAMNALNAEIENDSRLGEQYCIGHSYVTPHEKLDEGTTGDWFRAVVKSEIHPLLEEYYFDAPERAKELADKLLAGFE
jgi:5-methylcytosine-specific restriction protein B